jgi:hypothetical protein
MRALPTLCIFCLLCGCAADIPEPGDPATWEDGLPPNLRLRSTDRGTRLTAKALDEIRAGSNWRLQWMASSGPPPPGESFVIRGDGAFQRHQTPPRTRSSDPRVEQTTTGTLPRDLDLRLRQILTSKSFTSLKGRYETAVADYHELTVWVVVGEEKFSVACSGYFPPAIRELSAFLQALRPMK